MNGKFLMHKAVLIALFSAAFPAAVSYAQTTVSKVRIVNVTPTSFSVAWMTDVPAVPDLQVFADIAGTQDLTTSLYIDSFPVSTGSSTAATELQREKSIAGLRSIAYSHGLMLVQVSGALADTPYYIKTLSYTENAASPVSHPADGSLIPVRTAAETAFVKDARMLLLDIGSTKMDTTGWQVILDTADTAYPIAATVGDGATPQQAVLNLADFIDAGTNSNWEPAGNLDFTAIVHTGFATGTAVAEFSIGFSGDFNVLRVESNNVNADHQTVALTITPGWNLISLPVEPDVTDVAQLFADSQGVPIYRGAVWGWSKNSYKHVQNAAAKSGYWLYRPHPDPVEIKLTGSLPAGLDLSLANGWNLNGPVFTMPAPAVSSQIPVIATWSGTAYQDPGEVTGSAQNRLLRLRGYWMYANETATVVTPNPYE